MERMDGQVAQDIEPALLKAQTALEDARADVDR